MIFTTFGIRDHTVMTNQRTGVIYERLISTLINGQLEAKVNAVQFSSPRYTTEFHNAQ